MKQGDRIAADSSGAAVKALGVFALAMINVAAVFTLRKLPPMAEYGWSSVGWCLLGALFFLVPLSLVSAELATGWPRGGGVYTWVKEAFGAGWGFLAIWCEWVQMLVWFPTVLSFIAATLAYAVNPALGDSKLFLFLVMMSSLWGCTLVGLAGPKASARISNAGLVIGTVIPAALIIVLGVAYPLMGNAIQIPFSPAALLPELSPSTLPFVATVVMLYFGMEMAGFHAKETNNPGRDFPRAIMVSAVFILTVTIISTLAIAFVVPRQSISFAAGIMQAFQALLDTFKLAHLVGPVALLVAVGALAQLATWIAGPARGLGEVARQGFLPPAFVRHDKNGSPKAVLLIQGVLGSVIAVLFIFVPNASAAYWFLTAMMIQLTCIMYLLIFAAVIKLRYSQPGTARMYTVPGGKAGIWVIAGAGFVACCYTIVMAVIPPAGMSNMPPAAYVGIMLAGTAILALPPLFFSKFRKPGWSVPPDEPSSG
jgi:amino acid transporter